MHIRWTETAAQDLDRICDYVERQSNPAIAQRVAAVIYERISSLERFPGLGRAGRKVNTRELVIAGLPYVAIYRIHDHTVDIIRILHGAQSWP